MESALIGERAIQGQIQQAYTEALLKYKLPPSLNRLFQSAMHVGKPDAKRTDSVVYFAEYALLPITSRSSEAAKLLEGKRLNGKKLKELFFEQQDWTDEKKTNKLFAQLTVYSGMGNTSVTSAFASHFGENSSQFRGKRISGDDIFLNKAIAKDPFGVTINVLPNIFDLKSRRLKEEISLLHIGWKKEWDEKSNEQITLDELITLLEQEKVDEVVVEKVGVFCRTADPELGRFLHWVLTDGIRYNHDYGLLNLDRKIADAQIRKLKE